MAEQPPWKQKRPQRRTPVRPAPKKSSSKRKGELPPWARSVDPTRFAPVGPGGMDLTLRSLPPVPHHSIWGQIGGFGGNVGKGLWGIVPGMISTGKNVGQDIYHNPLLLNPGAAGIKGLLTHEDQMPRTYKNIIVPLGKGYKYKYIDPVVQHDPRLLATRALYEDPIGTAFDVASLATAGVGLGVRAGMISRVGPGASITLRSPGMASIEKGIGGRTQFGRHGRVLTDKAIKAMDARRKAAGKGPVPLIGEQARYSRAHIANEGRFLARHANRVIPYLAARRKLSPAEEVAVDVMHDFPTHASIEEYKKGLATPEGEQTLSLLDDPKVMKAFTEGPQNKNIARFLKASERLGEHSSELAGLAEHTVKQRRYQQLLMQQGFSYQHAPFKYTDPFGGWSDDALGRPVWTDEHGGGHVQSYNPETGMVTIRHGGSAKVTPEQFHERLAARVAGEDVPNPKNFEYPKEVPLSSLRDPKAVKLYPPSGPHTPTARRIPTDPKEVAQQMIDLQKATARARARVEQSKGELTPAEVADAKHWEELNHYYPGLKQDMVVQGHGYSSHKAIREHLGLDEAGETIPATDTAGQPAPEPPRSPEMQQVEDALRAAVPEPDPLFEGKPPSFRKVGEDAYLSADRRFIMHKPEDTWNVEWDGDFAHAHKLDVAGVDEVIVEGAETMPKAMAEFHDWWERGKQAKAEGGPLPDEAMPREVAPEEAAPPAERKPLSAAESKELQSSRRKLSRARKDLSGAEGDLKRGKPGAEKRVEILRARVQENQARATELSSRVETAGERIQRETLEGVPSEAMPREQISEAVQEPGKLESWTDRIQAAGDDHRVARAELDQYRADFEKRRYTERRAEDKAAGKDVSGKSVANRKLAVSFDLSNDPEYARLGDLVSGAEERAKRITQGEKDVPSLEEIQATHTKRVEQQQKLTEAFTPSEKLPREAAPDATAHLEDLHARLEDLGEDLPKHNAKILKEVEALGDPAANMVEEYHMIGRKDYDSGPDGTDEYRSDKEGALEDIKNAIEDMREEMVQEAADAAEEAAAAPAPEPPPLATALPQDAGARRIQLTSEINEAEAKLEKLKQPAAHTRKQTQIDALKAELASLEPSTLGPSTPRLTAEERPPTAPPSPSLPRESFPEETMPAPGDTFGEFMDSMNDPKYNPQIRPTERPPLLEAADVHPEHPDLANVTAARRKVEALDAEGAGDDFYQAAAGSFGRNIKWDDFATKREAVLDKLDIVEPKLRKRIAKDINEANDPVVQMKHMKADIAAEGDKVRRSMPKQGRTPEERVQLQAELDRLHNAEAELDKQIAKAMEEPKPEGPKIPERSRQDRLDEIEAERQRVVSEMIDQISGDIDKEGRTQPLYRHHTSVVRQTNPRPVAGGGTGPSPTKAVRQSEGRLASIGRAIYGEDTLAPTYMRVVREALSRRRHQQLLGSGIPVEKGTKLSELNESTGQKWVYLRQTAGDRPSHLEMTDADFSEAMDRLGAYKRGERQWNDMADELSTTDPETAAVMDEDGNLLDEEAAGEAPGGYHIVVPEKLVKQIAGEFQRNTTLLGRGFRGTTNVWRALVLNLRLGWLVNNVVGNTGLYFLSNTGPGALKSLVKPDLKVEDVAEHVPEQISTAYGTQMPAEGKIARRMNRSVVGKKVLRIPEHLRNADIWYEQRLRRATLDRALNADPKLKEMRKSIDSQTKTMRELKIDRLKSDPKLVDHVSAEAYRTLGNFNNLSPFEQNVVRQVVPFYAWYRAITKIALQLPLDNPIRGLILNQIGREGYDSEVKYGEPPIHGAVPMFGGILRTGGFNPFATIPQTAGALTMMGKAALGTIPHTGVKQPSPFELSYAAGIVNPFISWPVTGGLWHTFRGLPESRVIWPMRKTSTYSDPGYRAEWLNYIGLPYRQLVPANPPRRLNPM